MLLFHSLHKNPCESHKKVLSLNIKLTHYVLALEIVSLKAGVQARVEETDDMGQRYTGEYHLE
jgi:hypothetical protein